jgi:hypothetical protein
MEVSFRAAVSGGHFRCLVFHGSCSAAGDFARTAAPLRRSRHFERDPIPYALETDWLAGAAGIVPEGLPLSSNAKSGNRSRRTQSRRAHDLASPQGTTAVKPAGHKFLMQRFESCRPSQPVRLQRLTYEGRSATLLRSSPPLAGASVLSASRLEPLVPFPLSIAVEVLTFRARAWLRFAPPTCRTPLGQSQGIPQADPGGRVSPRF